MSQILHLTCSPRVAESHSAALSTAIVQRLFAVRPGVTHIQRDLGAAPPDRIDGPYASSLVAGEAETGLSSPALDRSAAAIAELVAADMLVIGTPMHNFTVPAALKAWIDLVVRPFHTFAPSANGKVALLPDKPVFVAIASGGHFHGEGAAQPDFLTPYLFHGEGAAQPDFLTPYLSAVLGCIGLRSVHFLPLQRTARATANDLEQQTHALLNRVDNILRHMKA